MCEPGWRGGAPARPPRPALGFGFPGSGFRVSGFGFRVPDFEFRISGFGFTISGFSVRVQCEKARSWGGELKSAGYRV